MIKSTENKSKEWWEGKDSNCKHKWDYSDPDAWECTKCGELCSK